MTPIAFKEQNVVVARDQKEYQPLPAFQDDTYTISCWKLTWRERLTVLFTGRVWMMLMTWSKPVTPSMLVTSKPFGK